MQNNIKETTKIIPTINPPLCACGCCEPVKWNHNKKCWNRFINQHSIRCFTEETYKKVSNSLKLYKYPQERIDTLIRNRHDPTGDKRSEETKRKQSQSGIGRHDHNGDKNPNWKGGISLLPYSAKWTDQLKQNIFRRDGYDCQNPNCQKTRYKLTVHHINYDKMNCSYQNLITLCISCNSKANFNRNHWKKLYYRIIEDKYGFLPPTCS